MSILAWLVIGLAAGFLASMVINIPGSSLLTDFTVGVAGALAGELISSLLRLSPPSGVNLYGIFVSFAGAVVLLLGYHAFFRRGVTQPAPTPNRSKP